MIIDFNNYKFFFILFLYHHLFYNFFFSFFFIFLKNLYYLNHLINFDYIRLICLIFILRLGGLPPFSIFVLKFTVIYFCILNNYIFGCFMLILSSLISLFYYIRFSIYLFLNSQLNFNFLSLSLNLKLITYSSFFINIFSFFFIFKNLG